MIHSQQTLFINKMKKLIINSLAILFHTYCFCQSDTISKYVNEYKNFKGHDYYYNLACLYSKSKNIDSAFYYLNYAIEKGARDGYALFDRDFENLYKDSRWVILSSKINRIYIEENSCVDTLTLIKLRDFLHEDQYLRYLLEINKYSEQSKLDFKTLDSLNIAEIEQYLSKITFPTIKTIGKKGMENLFIFILHMPYKLKLKYENNFNKAVIKGDFTNSQQAYFIDKMLIADNKKQRYGTQLEIVDSNKRYRLKEVENLQVLNSLRAKMGLETIEEYLESMGATLE
jgi:hypothetical protein